MTSTPCQSAALDRIIALWTAKIAEFLHIIVETILTIAEIIGTTLRELQDGHADIGAVPARITENRKVDLDLSLSAQMYEAWQATSPQVLLLLVRSREEQPAEANGDDAEGKLMGLAELEDHDTGSERRTCPHVKC